MAVPLRRKNKPLRVAAQLLFIIAACFWVGLVIIERGSPDPLNPGDWSYKEGFLALSYGALSRTRDGPNMPRSLFKRHLEALKKAGYQTITTANVIDFYQTGKPLPHKAVYLMFEGGRRDSAIYGQEGLAGTGMRANMFLYTGLISSWNRTILTQSQVQSMGRSEFWDVGVSGHDVYLPEDDLQRRRYFLADFRRDRDGRSLENVGDFSRRAEADYAAAINDVMNLTQRRPQAFVFMPANSLGGSLAPEVTAINRSLIEDNFSFAFTREGPAFNHRSANPRELTRMRVAPDCEPDQLLAAMASWLPVETPYQYGGSADAARWRREIGVVEFAPEELVLGGGGASRSLAWLIGSDGWRNVACRFTVPSSRTGSGSLYLRYASRDEFVRVHFRDGLVHLQERLPGTGLVTLYSHHLDGHDSINVGVLLTNNRIRMAVDGVPLINGSFAVSQPNAGRFAVEGRGGDGSAFVIAELSVRPVAERWIRVEHADTVEGLDGLPEPVTAVVTTADPGASPEATAALLLKAADRGLDRYALMPAGILPDGPPDLASDTLPKRFIGTIWTGVILVPTAGSSFAGLAASIEKLRTAGLTVTVLADAAMAEGLARHSVPLQFDFLMLNTGSALSLETDRILRHRYTVLAGFTGIVPEGSTP